MTGCATQSRSFTADYQPLLHDQLFVPPLKAIPTATDIFALTGDQLSMLDDIVKPRLNSTGAMELVDGLFKRDYGAFDYDNSYSRSASETLRHKAGNCLSLVIMTAAIAKHFDIPFKYQNIKSTPVWDREGDLYLINGHINIRLIAHVGDKWSSIYHPVATKSITIDFIPEASRRGIAREVIDESRVLAMFYSNLAADEMVRQNWSRAYWLLRAAIEKDADYPAVWNNLGVVYRNIQQDSLAEKAYRHALSIDPNDDNTVSNLVMLLLRQERYDEMYHYQRQYDLAQLNNPFYYFDRAELAYEQEDYYQAIHLYKKAIKRSDFVDRFYFGIFKSYWRLNKYGEARKYLELAERHSQDLKDRQRYNAKLSFLNEGISAVR